MTTVNIAVVVYSKTSLTWEGRQKFRAIAESLETRGSGFFQAYRDGWGLVGHTGSETAREIAVIMARLPAKDLDLGKPLVPDGLVEIAEEILQKGGNPYALIGARPEEISLDPTLSGVILYTVKIYKKNPRKSNSSAACSKKTGLHNGDRFYTNPYGLHKTLSLPLSAPHEYTPCILTYQNIFNRLKIYLYFS